MFGSSGKKIKVPSSLYEQLEKASNFVGCTSVDEYVEKVLSSDCARILQMSGKNAVVTDDKLQDIKNKLKGLGYLE